MNKNVLREYPLLCEAVKKGIRYVCNERKISLRELSEKVGVTREMLNYFLIGQKMISQDTLRRIVRALGFITFIDLAVFPYLDMCRKELHSSDNKKRKSTKRK